MKSFKRRALAISALLICAQFSMDQEEGSVSGGGKKPAVNFTGTIVDNTGRPFKASHINISGLYKQIPVYSKPINMQESDYNPTINTIRLDLSEVATIKVPDPERVHMFKERKYILLDVYLTNNPQKKYEYIVEDNKRVFCNQINGSDPIERELAFPAIQTITIKNFVKTSDKPGPKAPNAIKRNPPPAPKARRAPVAPKPIRNIQFKQSIHNAPPAPKARRAPAAPRTRG